MKSPGVLSRTISTPIILIAILLVIALATMGIGSGPFTRTIVEMLIRVVIVVGLYVFIGNSGVISFGHIGFMCLGAYAAAWFTIPPAIKQYSLRGLPEIIATNQLPFVVSAVLATLFAGIVAWVFGRILMRLSGIAASIATFAMLAMINTVYSNWESVTGATSSIVRHPMKTGLWTAFIGACLAVIVAYLHSISRSGLALRAARDEAIAASASGVDIERERRIAFVLSGFILGFAGVLYAHFLGVVNPDAFYLGLTFTTLSMLVIGGMNSLSGAVIGTVVLSLLIQALRWLEQGLDVGGTVLSLPLGVQEIAIGAIMIAILVFRPSGITGNRELRWPRRARARASESSAQTGFGENALQPNGDCHEILDHHRHGGVLRRVGDRTGDGRRRGHRHRLRHRRSRASCRPMTSPPKTPPRSASTKSTRPAACSASRSASFPPIPRATVPKVQRPACRSSTRARTSLSCPATTISAHPRPSPPKAPARCPSSSARNRSRPASRASARTPSRLPSSLPSRRDHGGMGLQQEERAQVLSPARHLDRVQQGHLRRLRLPAAEALGRRTRRQRHLQERGRLDRGPDHAHQEPAEEPDAIMLCSMMPGVVSAIKQIRAAGITAPILNGSGVDGSYWLNAVPDLSNFFVPVQGSIYGDDPNPDVNKFNATYKQVTGGDPSSQYVYPGYVMVDLWAKAVERAKTTEAAAVVAELEKMKDEPTLFGPRTFTNEIHHQNRSRYLVVETKGGKPGVVDEWTISEPIPLGDLLK